MRIHRVVRNDASAGLGFRLRLGLLLALLTAPLAVDAQEALRQSLASEAAARSRRSTADIPYNIKLGDAKLRFSAGLGLELNDNINVAETNAQSDFIIRPTVDTDFVWPLTEQNTLQLTMGLGYSKFLEFDENDTMLIRPGSQLSFDVFVDNFKINLHDQFSFFQDPTQNGAVNAANVTNSAGYGLGENTAGLRVDWDLNRIIVTAGYDYLLVFATSEEFSFLDRTGHQFALRGRVVTAPELAFGVESTLSLNRYSNPGGPNSLSDSDQLTFGPFVDWRLSQFIRVSLQVGLQDNEFATLTGTTNTPSSRPDTSGYYATLGIEHEVNRYLTYTIQAGHQVGLGVNTDAINLSTIRWVGRWRALRDVDFNTDLYYEHGEETGAITSTLAPETFNRYGVSVGLGYMVTEKLSAGLRYTFVNKESDQPGRGYTQNVVGLNLLYRF